MAITLVSEATTGGSGNSGSYSFSPGGRNVSADGRYVVYNSQASDLVTGDTNGHQDIFLYDTANQTTTLISSDASGDPSNNASYFPSISADGRYVVFYSHASDLVAGDTNGNLDIFLYDTVSETTTLISNDVSGDPSDNGSYQPSISADGRYVVYSSLATDLVTGDTNGYRDIFLYDTVNQTTTLVSSNASGGPSDYDSYTPSISADGRYVVYNSSATDLVANDPNGTIGDIFLYDTENGTNTLISKGDPITGANGYSARPSISSDGRYIAFESSASNLVANDLNGATQDIFLYDTLTKSTVLISSGDPITGASAISYNASISADGLFVAFYSHADNLLSGDTNGYSDVFIYNSETGVTELVTVDTGGSGTNNFSYAPSISGDGSTIFFESIASDLVANDTNGTTWDVFLADNPLFDGPTTGIDTLVGDGGYNTVTFVATTLTSDDLYDGLGGNDTVYLAGGGIFDFANTTFTSVEDIKTDGSNTVFDFSGFGASEADREGIAGLISSAAGSADSVHMGEWNYDLTLLGSLFDAGIETVEWSRPNGFDFSAVRNGSGQTVVSNTDGNGVRVYASIDQTFDPNGILRESVMTYDDGRIATTTYNAGGGMTGMTITDPLNAVNYQSLENVYSGGLLQSSSLTFDNGNTSVKTYTSGVLTQTVETDVADDFTWDVKTTTYNTSGVKTGYTVDYDAGEARSQMSFAYTGGILTNRTITNSDGSASEASYNTSGELQYVRNTASDGTQFILGGTGDNTLTGGTLDDIFKGQAGSDLFKFVGTVGNDTILDFTDGQDRLDLKAYDFNTLADLQNANAISEVDGNTVIDLGVEGSVTLIGFALSDFDNSDLVGLPAG
jgi:Tol biopolymer transport system component